MSTTTIVLNKEDIFNIYFIIDQRLAHCLSMLEKAYSPEEVTYWQGEVDMAKSLKTKFGNAHTVTLMSLQ